MKYQIGKPGRMIVAKFDDHDDVLGNLVDMQKKKMLEPESSFYFFRLS